MHRPALYHQTHGAPVPAAGLDHLGRWAQLCAALAFVLAFVILIGDRLFPGLPLSRLWPGFAAMVPPTALSVMGAALALTAARFGWRRSARLLAGAVMAFALWRLGAVAVTLSQIDLHSDRVSVGTALGLVLVCVALFELTARADSLLLQPGLPATLGGILALVCLTGYAFDAPGLYDFFLLSGMSVPTALCLLLLSMAILLQDGHRSWPRHLLGRSAGARLARLLLVPSVVAPFVLTALALAAADHGVFSIALSHALLADVLMVSAVGSLVLIARNRSQEEARMITEMAWLRDVLDATEAAAFGFDDAGDLVLANRLALSLTDGAPAEWLQETAFFIPGTYEPLTGGRHPRNLVSPGGGDARLYAGWLDGAGREHSLRLSSHRIGDALSGRHMTILTILDETESWSARDQITRIERLEAVGVMAGGAAHEFSNIIGVIQLSADVGLLKCSGEDAAPFEAIVRACDRGADLTERLLTLSRDSLGTLAAHDLVALTRATAPVLIAALPGDIELAFALPDAPLYAELDRSDFEAALLNLVINAANAIRAAPGAARLIRLTLRPAGEMASVTVQDRGAGMDEETLRRATTPFFTSRAGEGGTGLGLSMVEAFARRSGGELSIRSAPGAGTTVEITLPLREESGERHDGEPAEPVQSLAGLRVLVVEDDPQFREALPAALLQLGAEVERFVEAERALERLERGPGFDLVLSDIRLPGGMSGTDLAEIVAQRFPELPMLLLSGFQGKRGAVPPGGLVLRKPVRLRVLANAIRTVMAAQKRSGGAGRAK
ncbi:ATP-binding protein [Salipiger sp. P9]|uniref:ATP-binding protein n=1 Tax=Salipiger pentaromativorans TaxID=2943193 RepID=UPI00215806FA|nr:ATP-binding protein [Salipiger pentaromativorans]MCR8549119.1 ATP-binding protein [Salipiger pentaromativorans]